MLSIFRRDDSPESVKLNDRGFGRLDTLLTDSAAEGDTRERLRARVAIVFGLRTQRELNRFWRVNING